MKNYKKITIILGVLCFTPLFANAGLVWTCSSDDIPANNLPSECAPTAQRPSPIPSPTPSPIPSPTPELTAAARAALQAGIESEPQTYSNLVCGKNAAGNSVGKVYGVEFSGNSLGSASKLLEVLQGSVDYNLTNGRSCDDTNYNANQISDFLNNAQQASSLTCGSGYTNRYFLQVSSSICSSPAKYVRACMKSAGGDKWTLQTPQKFVCTSK